MPRDDEPIPPDDDPSRVVTYVNRDGECVAALVHDAGLPGMSEHVQAVGAAAALALENERLDAELRAKIGELRSSRERMLRIGLEERRRLERDLHDGAQQRLVSMALNIRLARAKLNEDPLAADQLLASAGSELDSALEELRELARGIHPAVLTDRGLGTALETLANRAPVPVELGELPDERLPEAVELAAYFVVAEALTNVAKYSKACTRRCRCSATTAACLWRWPTTASAARIPTAAPACAALPTGSPCSRAGSRWSPSAARAPR